MSELPRIQITESWKTSADYQSHGYTLSFAKDVDESVSFLDNVSDVLDHISAMKNKVYKKTPQMDVQSVPAPSPRPKVLHNGDLMPNNKPAMRPVSSDADIANALKMEAIFKKDREAGKTLADYSANELQDQKNWIINKDKTKFYKKFLGVVDDLIAHKQGHTAQDSIMDDIPLKSQRIAPTETELNNLFNESEESNRDRVK